MPRDVELVYCDSSLPVGRQVLYCGLVTNVCPVKCDLPCGMYSVKYNNTTVFEIPYSQRGVVLFCKDEEIRTDLIETTVNYALDFKPLREAAIYLLKVYFVLIKRRIKYGRK